MTATTKSNAIQHIERDLYRVRLDEVKFAEGSESEALSFRNPRCILGSTNPKGFSREEMTELREAIRTEGLKQPILLRWIEIDGERNIQCIGGERRCRCIRKLVADNEQCWDAAEETFKPAAELYQYVDARINNLDDASAWKHAFDCKRRHQSA